MNPIDKILNIIDDYYYILLPLALIFVVFLASDWTGSVSKCKAAFQKNTIQYEDCIHRVKDGGRVYRDKEGNAIGKEIKNEFK